MIATPHLSLALLAALAAAPVDARVPAHHPALAPADARASAHHPATAPGDARVSEHNPAATARATRVSAQGIVRSAGERQPVAGARIYAAPRQGDAWIRETQSGPDGSFRFSDLPTLDIRLTIVAPGHARFEHPTTAAYWRRRKPPTIYLQPTEAGRYRTVVAQERGVPRNPFRVQLAPDEIAGLPGSQGDPLRALQNLPGSARIPGGLGLIVLRGATPNQSQVFLGEHPVPRAFHIPGLASVVSAGVLGGLDYVPGNFAPHYGNAVGGLVVMKPRVGRRDGVHGAAKLDLISAGAHIEGPFGRGSYLFAGQAGYLDLVLRALGPAVLGPSFLRPRYGDYQLIFDHPAGPGAQVTARILGAGDDLRYRPANHRSDDVSLGAAFHRIDLVYRKRRGRFSFMFSPALRFDRAEIAGAEFLRRRDAVVGLLRAELGVVITRRFRLDIGADTQLDRYRLRNLGAVNSNPFLAPVDETARGLDSATGAYLAPQLTLGRFTVSPGLRVSLFTGTGEPRFSVDPRLSARWAPHARVAVQLAAGRYSQPFYSGGRFLPGATSPLDSLGIPSTIVLPAAVRYLDPRLDTAVEGRRLGLSQAIQLAGGLHLVLTDSLHFDGTVFYRRVRRPDPPSPQGVFLVSPVDRDDASVTYGVEVMLRHDLTRRLFGWIAYTWMHARIGVITDGAAFHHLRAADFDQRHNLVALVGYKLPRRWQLGARFRLVTGLPYTPVVGGVKVDGAAYYYYPLPGEPNSARMPIFHQLDIRLDKTWIRPRSIIAAYLDVQNVYNRQNAEGLWYLHDFSAARAVVGIPILPVLGLRIDY